MQGHWVWEGYSFPTLEYMCYQSLQTLLDMINMMSVGHRIGGMFCETSWWLRSLWLWLSVKRGVGRPVNVCCSSQNHFWSFFWLWWRIIHSLNQRLQTLSSLRSYRSTLVKILHLIRETAFYAPQLWVWGVQSSFSRFTPLVQGPH